MTNANECLDTVVMPKKEFDDLLDYSCSYPTGTTLGKEWKRRKNYYKEELGWWLCEYIESDIPGRVGIAYAHLEIEGVDND